MNKPVSEAEIFEVPIETALGKRQIRLIEEASRTIGEINNFASKALRLGFVAQAIKNAEALASARIEGTTGNLQDLYMEEALADERKKELKLYSAINYRVAMNEIEEIIGTHKRIDLSLVRHLHKILTENDPATKGESGVFRTSEVKIRNSKLGDFYPAAAIKVNDHMERMVEEIADREDLPTLVKSAITHYQFESIHPFEDGNGRTGRMLIISEMLLDGSLRAPMLNLSEYFDVHRDEYIAALRNVTETNSYEEWVTLFLTGIIEQGKKVLEFIEALQKIEKEDELRVNESLRSPVAIPILRLALNNLYVTVPMAAERLDKLHVKSADFEQVARTNINRMVEEGILEVTDFKFGKARVFAHKKLRDFMFGKTRISSEETRDV